MVGHLSMKEEGEDSIVTAGKNKQLSFQGFSAAKEQLSEQRTGMIDPPDGCVRGNAGSGIAPHNHKRAPRCTNVNEIAGKKRLLLLIPRARRECGATRKCAQSTQSDVPYLVSSIV